MRTTIELNKLSLITSAIILCLLTVIYFQINWLNKTYEIKKQELSRYSEEALKQAIIENEDINRSFITDLLKSKLSSSGKAKVVFTEDSLKISFENRPESDELAKAFISFGFDKGRFKVELPKRPLKNGPTQKHVYNIADKHAEMAINKLIKKYFINDCTGSTIKDSLNRRIWMDFENRLTASLLKFLNKNGIRPERQQIQPIYFCSENEKAANFVKNKSFVYHHSGDRYVGTMVHEYSLKEFSKYIGEKKRWVAIYFHGFESLIIPQMIFPVVSSLVIILFIIFLFVILIRIIKSQKRLAEIKDDFINNMTHELKTPIATVSAAVEGLQNFNALQDKEKTERYLDTSRRELKRLDNLVTKVLNMASFEKKDIELTISKVSLEVLINEIIETEKLKADKEVRFNFENRITANTIQVDATHFRNSVANIIDNAVKYSGTPAEVNIVCTDDADKITISIKDNGPGIPVNQQDRIFEKFYRVPSGNLHSVKGTGLGLSYSKYIIEKHGGSIAVKSDFGKGS